MFSPLTVLCIRFPSRPSSCIPISYFSCSIVLSLFLLAVFSEFSRCLVPRCSAHRRSAPRCSAPCYPVIAYPPERSNIPDRITVPDRRSTRAIPAHRETPAGTAPFAVALGVLADAAVTRVPDQEAPADRLPPLRRRVRYWRSATISACARFGAESGWLRSSPESGAVDITDHGAIGAQAVHSPSPFHEVFPALDIAFPPP